MSDEPWQPGEQVFFAILEDYEFIRCFNPVPGYTQSCTHNRAAMMANLILCKILNNTLDKAMDNKG